MFTKDDGVDELMGILKKFSDDLNRINDNNDLQDVAFNLAYEGVLNQLKKEILSNKVVSLDMYRKFKGEL